jgi:hypothetical protein
VVELIDVFLCCCNINDIIITTIVIITIFKGQITKED